MQFKYRFGAIFRWARVVFSLTFFVLFLVILIFWVRSYFYADSVWVRVLPTEYIQVHAGYGRMCVWFEHKPIDRWARWHSRPLVEHVSPAAENRIPWFNLAFWPTFARLYTAHWFLAVVAAICAVGPWCPSRFSLRFLLTAVTAVAAITATIVWIDASF